MGIVTHSPNPSTLENRIEELVQKITGRGDLPHVSVSEQLQILKELSSFPFGQFLIQHKGLNGYWTDYLLMHPKRGRITGLNSAGHKFSALENFILNEAPSALATQQRFAIFQKELQKRCYEGVTMASVPCGLMSDLLTLDFSELNTYLFFGVDIDPKAIAYAQNNIQNDEIRSNVVFFETDAWSFKLPKEVDVITSNGLNIYEKDDVRVVSLYSQIFHNLRPGGTLITSFLTLPPGMGNETEWLTSKIEPTAIRQQRIIFADILAAAWQAYRSSELTIKQLTMAGFFNIQIIPDDARIFPTVVAHRPDK